ncbi:hypothetical protein TNCV_3466831 [Trichonephila clavipes]|nr:hypothetical protein TNCV_3466831 [Trichonephila clavipes]
MGGAWRFCMPFSMPLSHPLVPHLHGGVGFRPARRVLTLDVNGKWNVKRSSIPYLGCECGLMLKGLDDRKSPDWWVGCGKEAWLQERFRTLQNILEPIFEVEISALYGKDIHQFHFHTDKVSSHASKSTARYLAKQESETGKKCIPYDEIPVKSPDERTPQYLRVCLWI